MDKKQNYLIVSGNGRNTGKTSFVCRVIAAVSKSYPVTAIKVSPHFHPERTNPNLLISSENFNIWLETDPWSNKDSSRMLTAGAHKVYYIEVLDNNLEKAMISLQPHLPDGPVIYESGGLRFLNDPGLFILLNSSDREEVKENFKKLSPMADKLVTFDGNGFDLPPEKVFFDGEKWGFISDT